MSFILRAGSRTFSPRSLPATLSSSWLKPVKHASSDLQSIAQTATASHRQFSDLAPHHSATSKEGHPLSPSPYSFLQPFGLSILPNPHILHKHRSFTMDATKAKNLDNQAPIETQFNDLYALIDSVDTCMMTTRASDGSLVSRAMATRKRVNGPDLYFVTNSESHKLDDIHHDSNVNISYVNSSREWVSVSGTAEIVTDRSKITELYDKSLRAWFGDKGDGVHDGGPNDPRICLIFVKVNSAHYQKNDSTAPVTLLKIVKAAVTGEPPKIGAMRDLDASTIEKGRTTN